MPTSILRAQRLVSCHPYHLAGYISHKSWVVDRLLAAIDTCLLASMPNLLPMPRRIQTPMSIPSLMLTPRLSGSEADTQGIDAVAFIGRGAKTLALEHVAEMAVAVGTHDLDAHHAV